MCSEIFTYPLIIVSDPYFSEKNTKEYYEKIDFIQYLFYKADIFEYKIPVIYDIEVSMKQDDEDLTFFESFFKIFDRINSKMIDSHIPTMVPIIYFIPQSNIKMHSGRDALLSLGFPHFKLIFNNNKNAEPPIELWHVYNSALFDTRTDFSIEYRKGTSMFSIPFFSNRAPGNLSFGRFSIT